MTRFFRGDLLLALLFPLAAVNAGGQATVQIGLNFTGSSYLLNSQALPPDPNGVIGPGRFMEFINGTVAIYNRTNGASVQRKSDLKFWADAGLNTSAIAISDPRVIYDPATQRWFATQVDFDPGANDPTTEANDFLLAVSTTSDPTKTWTGFMIPSDPDNGDFADFPTLGLDSNAVYISGDFYTNSVAVGPGLLSIPKADLIAATPTITNLHWYGVMDYSVRGDVLQPAVCFDGSATGSILAMGDIGSDSSPHSNVVWFAVQNAGGTSSTLSASTSLTVAPYQVPDNADLGVPQFVAPQPDGTTLLQANDARLSAKVFAVGGVLYAAHTTELNGRMAVRWYRIRAADQTLLEQGTIADPNLDLFFPSIAANPYGTVVIGCNGSSLGTYINCYAYAGQTVNGQTTFGSSTLIQSGVVDYHDENDIVGDLIGTPTPSRWGDYNTLSVDAADPTQFWTIQMYPSGIDTASGFDEGIWSTQITQLIVTPLPSLAITPSGTNVVVSWPLYASSYQLFSSANLAPPTSWSNVTQKPVTNGMQISVTIPLANGTGFFRLQK
ncbi:MAG: hypothetical protein WAO02_02355 [Verrucomicrobiia bacterium]